MKLSALFRALLLIGLLLPHLFAETPAEGEEKHLREQVKEDMPGVAVLVACAGEILFQGGFGWRAVKASMHFVKGEDGKVIKAVHTQNGMTFDAPKVK